MSIDFGTQAFLMPAQLSSDKEKVIACIGMERFYDFMSPTAATGSFIGALPHKIATALMDEDQIAKSSLNLSAQLLLDPSSLNVKSQGLLSEPVILHDGEYVQLDIWALNLDGGNYEFKLFVDDELLDTMYFEVLMPKEGRARFGDQ